MMTNTIDFTRRDGLRRDPDRLSGRSTRGTPSLVSIGCDWFRASSARRYFRSVSNPPEGYPRVSPYLLYEDAAAAVDYLQRSFGFELRLSQIGAAGRTHNELILGDDGVVMLGQGGESFRSPRTLDVFPSSMVHIYVDDVKALHERAQTAGADVTELEDAPVGDGRFTATDPEGQLWVFAQRF